MKYIVLAIMVCLAFACSPDQLSSERYAKWVNEHLVAESENENFNFSLQYQPVEFQALREMKSEGIDETNFETIMNDFRGHHYMNLKVQAKNRSKIEVKNDLRFHAQRNFKIIVNQDTLPCVLYHLNEMQNELQIALVFRDENEREQIDDLQFFCNNSAICPEGLSIEIPKKYIQKSPNLVL